jgi:hypothetical protein
MLTFIKKIFGLGSAEPAGSEVQSESVSTAVDFVVSGAVGNVPLGTATYIPSVKPDTVKRVRAGVAPAPTAVVPASKPANKKRKPYRGNKPKTVVVAASTSPAKVAKVKSTKK